MWRGAKLQGKIQKISSPEPVLSHKMYKFLAKMNQNVPIPHHGKKNVNLIPCRELLDRKKLIVRPKEFLRDTAMPRLIRPNSVSGINVLD